MIVLLSNKWDLTVDLVVLELQQRGCTFVRLNTEDLRDWAAVISLPSADINLRHDIGATLVGSSISAVWNRRPGHPYDYIPPEQRPSLAVQKFVTDQWFSWLEALQLQPQVFWVNHPNANSRMENKVRQLKLAVDVGFRVPETLVTNDPSEVRRWFVELGVPAVCKALYSPLVEEPSQDFFVFTNLLNELPREFERTLPEAPVIFQRAVFPKMDYRVTVVGREVFAVRIHTHAGVIDWRTATEGVNFIQCSLPRAVEERCRTYVQAAGLVFGAIDLVESEAEFYFLEINPNGEWGWLQRPHGVPIASALCDVLVKASP